jgi:allantoate deiminase
MVGGIPKHVGVRARQRSIAKADAGRIARFMREVGTVGRDPRGGWTRLAFSGAERQAHAVFVGWAEDLGMSVHTDAIGNTFGELNGTSAQPAIVVGSHLDTVPRGGNFDGVAGIAGALEAARALSQATLDHPFRVAVFAGEEGARFGVPCIGSRICTGAFGSGTLESLADDSGRTVSECASEVGLRPDDADEARWPSGAVAAYLELHIEQGAVLENRGHGIGIVDSIAGSTRIRLSFHGRADHSGATPMPIRQDALAAAAELILDVERQASAHPTSVGTVGRIDVAPGSLTTVPGDASITVDIRDVDSDAQRELAELVLDEAVRVAGRRRLHVSAELLSDQSPVLLHKPIRERLGHAAKILGHSFCVMPSGASHDAAYVAGIAPAGMIFVPSRGGVSHAPEEWTDANDIARAVDVMVNAIQTLDDEGPWRTSMPADEPPG